MKKMKSLSDPKFSKKDMDDRIEKLHYLLDLHRTYVLWAEMAKEVLYNNLAPRIYALGQVGYTGCGFHYSLEQELATLIARLAIIEEPCMNWIEKNWEESHCRIVYEVRFAHLCEQVVMAEQSALSKDMTEMSGRYTHKAKACCKVVKPWIPGTKD